MSNKIKGLLERSWLGQIRGKGRGCCEPYCSMASNNRSPLTKKLVKSVLPQSRLGGMAERPASYNAGFGIVEVIVATFVFSLISIIVISGFVDTLRLQRRGFAAQVIQEETLSAFESMTREIRVSQIQSPDDSNCTLTSLNIDHPVSGAIVYSVSNGIINKTVGGNTFPVTSSKVNFVRLNFCIRGSGIDDEQPRITIIASVQTASGVDGLRFDTQTTVSSRDVREEFLN